MDRLKHSLMKAEDDCKVERKHTLKLRHAMEQRPSQELLWELQQEKAQLQARVQELEASALPPGAPRPPQEGRADKSSPYIQVLEEDWRQALRDHQEQATTIFTLRKDLRQSEALRARVRHCGDGQMWPGGWRVCPGLPQRLEWGARSRAAPYPSTSVLLQEAQGPDLPPSPLPALPGAVRTNWWSGSPGLGGPEGIPQAADWGPRAEGYSCRSPQCAEEREVFELQCLALRKDSKMYKDRIEAILLQLEEVAIERDQVKHARSGRGTGGQGVGHAC